MPGSHGPELYVGDEFIADKQPPKNPPATTTMLEIDL
jgi:hypothetical protein